MPLLNKKTKVSISYPNLCVIQWSTGGLDGVARGYHMSAVLESSTPHLNHQVTTGMVEVIRFGSEISMFQQTFFANSASQVASHRLWAFTFCYPKQSRLSRSGDKVYLSQENLASCKTWGTSFLCKDWKTCLLELMFQLCVAWIWASFAAGLQMELSLKMSLNVLLHAS